MKMGKIVGERFKERPSDCVIDSHAIMTRGGYIKQVSNGIYSQYTVLRRICQKIEGVIRSEMDAIDGQEVLFPVVLPATLWEESGRFESVGSELMRMKDRNGAGLVLGMTHEEAAVHLVRDYANTYTRYPFMIYQIQTKYRDEARPRAGLIRVREFTMKDAYSFHTSQEDLERYYALCFAAYERIFKRAGLKKVVTVASDSGMMGGSVSHEYMLLTPVGEDSIAICTECDFRANMEAAENITENAPVQRVEMQEAYTPNMQTIEEVSGFLKVPVEQTCKAVVYQRNKDDSYVIVFTRGDMDVNETKLTNKLACEVYPAIITEDCGIVAGFIGPCGLSDKITLLFDSSLKGAESLVCGANKAEHHCTGFNIERDFGRVEYVDLSKIHEGGICPQCGKRTISISRGIEVGNIFQLGTKYTKAMDMQYLDQNGKSQYPIMGCYGIGVGRLAASVCEESHDEYGPIWPISIAPWQVHICGVRADNAEVSECAEKLQNELQGCGLEVIYDDRQVTAGVMFADADLLGVPVRIIVSPRNLKEGCCEIVTRDKSINERVALENAVARVNEIVAQLRAAL